MTDPESGAPGRDALADILGYDATLQHIQLLQRKRDDLTAKQRAAEEQHLHRIAGAYRDGFLTDDELAQAYLEFQDASGEPGFAKTWERIVGVSRVRLAQIAKGTHLPNGPHGSWTGDYPFAGGPFPRDGSAVAYVLFDAANQPCYAGSTEHFSIRLSKHAREGKRFVYWHAYPCADRAAAYDLEDRLLHEHKPYLNKRAAA